MKAYYANNKERVGQETDPTSIEEIEDTPDEPHKTDLLEYLKNINPYVFEHVCRDLLQELDIEELEITTKSNDGGIDGFGVIKVNDIVGLKLAFQCKRYAGSVPSQDIQKFKGAFSGDYEKGLFITTGVFTSQAKREARKSPRVDLIDGELLIDKMIEKGMGIRQTYTLDTDYFAKFEA